MGEIVLPAHTCMSCLYFFFLPIQIKVQALPDPPPMYLSARYTKAFHSEHVPRDRKQVQVPA